MAGEIEIAYGTTGRTLYAVVRSSTGTVWNTADVAFEAFNAANWTDYDIALTEQGASGYYVGTFPAAVAGVYNVEARDRAGGSPAVTDPLAGAGSLDWTGTAVMPVVKLGDVAHGGTVATLTFERLVGASTTTDEPALKLTGNGAGAGLRAAGGATGNGIHATGTNGGHGATFSGAGGGSYGLWAASVDDHALVAQAFAAGKDGQHGVGGAGGYGFNSSPAANGFGTDVAAIFAGGDIDGYTLEETLKLCLAALAGKLSGAATTTVTIRAADDSKDRLTATVDVSGNRTAITYDAAG